MSSSLVGVPGGVVFLRLLLLQVGVDLVPVVHLDDSMVHGLEAGADDYLAKPINPALLCTKIRAVLRRSKWRVMRLVRGNLADVSFTSVVRSCELKGLTGVLEVQVLRTP